MSAETREFSPSQRGFQRLLLREYKSQRRPGDGWKSTVLSFELGVGATLTDLAESHLIDKVFRNPMEDKIKAMQQADDPAGARKVQGLKFAGEFAEEWVSDSAYASVVNAWVRLMTGIDGAKYVSETSAFISDWANVVSQVFLNDQLYPKKFVGADGKAMKGPFGIKKAYQSMDFVNPVNIEAAFRLFEEIPAIGDGVAWVHDKSDKLIASVIGKWTNTAASKSILGFHIGKNIKPV